MRLLQTLFFVFAFGHLAWAAPEKKPKASKPPAAKAPAAKAVAKTKPKPKAKVAVPATRAPTAHTDRKDAPPVPQAVIVPSSSLTMGQPRALRYRREMQTGFGLLTLEIPGVTLHMQMRFLVANKQPLYLGVDGMFTLFQTGHYLSLLPGIWYDLRLAMNPLMTLSLGVVGGPAFTLQHPSLPTVTYAAFGELNLGWEVDDLASVHGQFRPGIVGGKFAFAMSFLIGYRFR